MEHEEDAHCIALIHCLPGSCALRTRQAETSDVSVLPPVAYLLPDETQHQVALELIENSQIDMPSLTDSGLALKCYSSLATEFDPLPQKYAVFLGFNLSSSIDLEEPHLQGPSALQCATVEVEKVLQEEVVIDEEGTGGEATEHLDDLDADENESVVTDTPKDSNINEDLLRFSYSFTDIPI
ncbi:hypothetical protein NEOLEDRAFT_1179089 [Neolentinus lepideus HHB14362 ss-1]|uniref:Uncharacterized protein n=1 Tax=Neolentinus lepideus HHB14362 ss-1 TaxID=1314782 RepID=A0A165S6C8_9AGAM|nr:hypothetical protein NEOLEDRAFT_1179089 [Neolentinus lepideus HHB14362 ss-1]